MAFPADESWVVLSPIEASIKRKIEAVGTPLREWDISINYGIKTGCNEAFIIPTSRRDEILAACRDEAERERTAALIRPILRGRDIKRYGYEWAELWIIATFPSRHYDIDCYPAVRDYLLSFGREKLEQTGATYTRDGQEFKARKKTNYQWFETQDSISYWEDFDEHKIVWPRLTRISKKESSSFPRFCAVEAGTLIVDSLCFFVGEKLDWLCSVLNSTFAAYYYFRNIAILDNGGMQMRQQYVELTPIPQQLQCSGEFSDEYIYTAFGFTEEERTFIERFVEKKLDEILSGAH